jgi:hypothetical protein
MAFKLHDPFLLTDDFASRSRLLSVSLIVHYPQALPLGNCAVETTYSHYDHPAHRSYCQALSKRAYIEVVYGRPASLTGVQSGPIH